MISMREVHAPDRARTYRYGIRLRRHVSHGRLAPPVGRAVRPLSRCSCPRGTAGVPAEPRHLGAVPLPLGEDLAVADEDSAAALVDAFANRASHVSMADRALSRPLRALASAVSLALTCLALAATLPVMLAAWTLAASTEALRLADLAPARPEEGGGYAEGLVERRLQIAAPRTALHGLGVEVAFDPTLEVTERAQDRHSRSVGEARLVGHEHAWMSGTIGPKVHSGWRSRVGKPLNGCRKSDTTNPE